MSRPERRIQDHLALLYGGETAARLWSRLWPRLRQADLGAPASLERFSERDVVLITYGDQIGESGQSPLQSLAEFLEARVRGVVNSLHILPFFPYSSDDGFSVLDYKTVDPRLGTWDDVARLGRSFRLMFDLVINHISAQSRWFQGFLAGDPHYADYFITVPPDTDLSMVVRPRARPLLTSVETAQGERWVWTTFSPDQIDLNFANPQVLLEIIDVLLFYVRQGAEIIRLDAIAYLWKETGSASIHLEQTHRVVQLLRAVLDWVAPHVSLITETNVPHAENVSYFGDGQNEAQMVYQFSLAPLILNAFHTADAGYLSRWAAQLSPPSQATTFFNFTASHDGVGVRPVEGILDKAAFQQLVERAQAHGGFVSFKTNPDGSKSPYELNISYFDALSDPAAVEQLEQLEQLEIGGIAVQVDRFLASQAIMLSLAGVPGIYIHSLLGSRSYHAGVTQTGRYRSINREKFERAVLEAALDDPTSLRHQVFERYLHLLRVRTAQPAFHPNGAQHVLTGHRALFALLRTAPDSTQRVLCLHNVSDQPQSFQVDLARIEAAHTGATAAQDLLTGMRYPVDAAGLLVVDVAPYQVLWLQL
jgi:glucosylglycerate phosphorylase